MDPEDLSNMASLLQNHYSSILTKSKKNNATEIDFWFFFLHSDRPRPQTTIAATSISLAQITFMVDLLITTTRW